MKFTVRNKEGVIIPHQDPHDQGKISWVGSNREHVINAVENLPIYHRGKLKADLMMRNIPKKELYGYSSRIDEIELVMSGDFYNFMMTKDRFIQSHYEDGTSRYCYPVCSERLSTLYLSYNNHELIDHIAMFNMVEREVCKGNNRIYSISDLRKAKDDLMFLEHFRDYVKEYELLVSGDEPKYLELKLEGHEPRCITRLGRDQLKTIKSGTYKMDETIANQMFSKRENIQALFDDAKKEDDHVND